MHHQKLVEAKLRIHVPINYIIIGLEKIACRVFGTKSFCEPMHIINWTPETNLSEIKSKSRMQNGCHFASASKCWQKTYKYPASIYIYQSITVVISLQSSQQVLHGSCVKWNNFQGNIREQNAAVRCYLWCYVSCHIFMLWLCVLAQFPLDSMAAISHAIFS